MHAEMSITLIMADKNDSRYDNTDYRILQFEVVHTFRQLSNIHSATFFHKRKRDHFIL